jgi:hypothetical protein
MLSVTAVVLIDSPLLGLKLQVVSDGNPVQVYVSGSAVVLLLVTINPFVPVTAMLTCAVPPGAKEKLVVGAPRVNVWSVAVTVKLTVAVVFDE